VSFNKFTFIVLINFLVMVNVVFSGVVKQEPVNFKLLKVKRDILDVQNKNAIKDYRVIYLNRGSSDGIFEGYHFKFYNGSNFIFRGACLDSTLFRSIWVTYNNYGVDKLDLNVNIVGKKVGDNLVPKRVKNVYVLLKKNIKTIRSEFSKKEDIEKYVKRMSYKNKLAKVDEETIKIIEENETFELNPNIEIDLISGEEEEESDYVDITISASPITFTRVPKTKEIGYSLKIKCADCGDKELEFYYSYDHGTELPLRSDFDEPDPDVLTTSNYYASLSFDWNKFYGPFTFWMFFDWERSRTSDVLNGEHVYSPNYLYSGIPLGIKWDIYESDTITDLSLSWGPQMDFEKDSYLDEDDDGNEIITTEKDQVFRHSIRFKFAYKPTTSLTFSNTMWYMPLHDFANKEFDWRDSGPFENTFEISYTTSSQVSFTYSNWIDWDYVTFEEEGIPSTNMTHSFEVSYTF